MKSRHHNGSGASRDGRERRRIFLKKQNRNGHQATKETLAVESLYETPLEATRSGALFHAHWYPTKISPESIALMIACHTKPGDLVFDGFGGSCTTAVAALLCSKPHDRLSAIGRARGLNPIWGPRRAVVYELTGLGSSIGQTLCSQPDPNQFASAATRLLDEAERRYGWMYRTADDQGNEAVARHFIWSEVLECSSCRAIKSIWDACVRLNPARISDRWKCQGCGKAADLNATPRILERTFDSLLEGEVTGKARRLSRVDGITGRRHWTRQPTSHDLELVARIQDEAVPGTVPVVPMMEKGGAAWGDLWRAGYHEGISHVHHFYTRRNLIALGALCELVENEPKPILPVEKNVFRGLWRKMKTIREAFATLYELKGSVEVRQGSSINTSLADGSVDYVFTDPPFGGNIPYSEVNFISEAWLGRKTRIHDEAVVSSVQSKSISAYESLLKKAFQEMRRILKPAGKATVVFHSTQSEVWGALTRAYVSAGFGVELSNILDKKQGSFKQVTTVNSAKGDPMLLLTRQNRERATARTSPEKIIERLVSHANAVDDPEEKLPQRIYSRFVAHYLHRHSSPPINADEFYEKLSLAKLQR